MRRLLPLALLALPLPLVLACKHPASDGDAGADGAPSASASTAELVSDAAPEASAAPTATHATGFGAPAAGVPCHAGTDTLGCSPDHNFKLSCSGGTWQAVQSCRGAGTCKGTGGAVTCDVGNPIIGDPCVAGSPPARCAPGNHAVQQCNGGKWAENVCMPPTSCKPNGNSGQPGCK